MINIIYGLDMDEFSIHLDPLISSIVLTQLIYIQGISRSWKKDRDRDPNHCWNYDRQSRSRSYYQKGSQSRSRSFFDPSPYHTFWPFCGIILTYRYFIQISHIDHVFMNLLDLEKFTQWSESTWIQALPLYPYRGWHTWYADK